MPWYTYSCPESHKTEARASYDALTAPCGTCGVEATRLPFYSKVEVSVPGEHFEPDHERFLDRAAYAEDAYQRAEQEVGGYIKRPKWLNAGVARARSRIIEGGTKRDLAGITEVARGIDANRPRH